MSRDYDDAFALGRILPAPVTLRTISQLFYDSLAISAWKSTGEASWALRVNPSSGNLHPTEGYLICGPIRGLCDTPLVCHYAPEGNTGWRCGRSLSWDCGPHCTPARRRTRF